MGLGLGVGEHFVVSDISALLPVTRRFIFLEEGDVAEIRRDGAYAAGELKHGPLALVDADMHPDAGVDSSDGVPLQLLAYHVAVLKSTDVDQPRNLAKSVTVE